MSSVGPCGKLAAMPAMHTHQRCCDLYLLLWGRWPYTDARFEVAGDRSLLAHWQRHAVVT
jgi:hypothetical protein